MWGNRTSGSCLINVAMVQGFSLCLLLFVCFWGEGVLILDRL